MAIIVAHFSPSNYHCTAMIISFDLTPVQYVCMLQKVSAQSPAFTTLKNANPNVRADASIFYSVDCSEAESELFLQIAKEHCFEAVPAIEQAIQISLNGGANSY
ncbi:MAG: hypothetical protein ACREX3_24995 [Gammaproteobacteria bacterium]